MAGVGGFSPLPLRLGGGISRVETIYRSLCAGRGTAYDTSDSSNVVPEIMAEARAIEALWSANRRLSLQWDPMRMTDFLGRWEAIFAVKPSKADTLLARRLRLVPKFRALIGPIQSTVADVASSLLGASFIAVEYTDLAHAHTGWPGGSPPDPAAWFSTICHLVIRVKQTGGQTFAEFVKLLGIARAELRNLLPVYTTFDFGVFNSGGVGGFLLDERDLDLETFDP